MHKTHDSEHDGREYSFEDLQKEWLPPEKLEKGLVATDMDGTMFDGDLGVVVFLEYLRYVHFWETSVKEFQRNLLPKKYKNLLIRGATGKIPELNPDECTFALKLVEDLVNLYIVIYKRIRKIRHPLRNQKYYQELRDGKPCKQCSLSRPAVNEFARKMIAFDELIMKMERYFSRQFGGQLLMRIRFFCKQKPRFIRLLTKSLVEKSQNGRDGYTKELHVDEKNRDIAKQQVGADEIPMRRVVQAVKIIESTRQLLSNLYAAHADINVISTNLSEIAEAAVNSSPYSFLAEGQNSQHVMTTQLMKMRKKPKKAKRRKGWKKRLVTQFTRQTEGVPVIGMRKAEIAQEIARVRGRVLLVACGDSLGGDGEMGFHALKNGGVFVAVGKNYESTRRTFHPLYERAVQAGIKDAGQKIWYVETDKPDNVRDVKR